MEMEDVASFFDEDPALDGYTNAYLFDCQTASFDDSASDGSTNRRRVVSCAPGINMPTRRCLSIYDEIWLVGDPTTDGFQGTRMRKNYAMRRSTGLLSVLTPGQAATVIMPVKLIHAHKLWYRDVQKAQEESDIDTFWNISVAPVEGLLQGMFLEDAEGTLFRVRQTYLPIQGLTIAQSDELDAGARKTAVFTNAGTVYDGATDSYPSTTVTGGAILMDTNQLFNQLNAASPVVAPGDRTLLIAKTLITPTTGTTVAFDDAIWRVLQVESELDAWVLRVRR